jgi:protein tyrosine/serine phosphatase
LTLAACGTSTRQSADIAGVDPHPAPIDNFQVVEIVSQNGLYRGGQPIENDKRDDWKYLKSIGVKTVIKLNRYSSYGNEDNELSSAKRHGINVKEILMQPEDFPHNWNLWATPTDEQIEAAVSMLEDKKNWPIYIHCSHGKDRTGLIVAIYRVRNDKYCKSKAANEMDFYGANPFLFGLKRILYRKDINENINCIK